LGKHAARIECLQIELDECEGQVGVWRRQPAKSP
jgi:hypothetical protein